MSECRQSTKLLGVWIFLLLLQQVTNSFSQKAKTTMAVGVEGGWGIRWGAKSSSEIILYSNIYLRPHNEHSRLTFQLFLFFLFSFFDHRGHYPVWTPPKSWWSHLLLKLVLSHALHPNRCSWYSAQVSRFRPSPLRLPFLICTCCAVVWEASAAARRQTKIILWTDMHRLISTYPKEKEKKPGKLYLI